MREKRINILIALPKKSQQVFGGSPVWHKGTFYKSRKRIARKLQNPRIASIHFHTLRHWKATMLYHQTKDILYVKEILGHKRIENTMKYINIERAIYAQLDDQKIHTKVARNVTEARKLIEEGWEYVHDMDGVRIYRKRK